MSKEKENLNIAYISSVCSEETYMKLQEKIVSPMQYSIQKFHNLIIKGIAKNENIKIDAISGIPVDRKKIKKTIFYKQITKLENIKYTHVGFINFPILKQVFINIGMTINLLKWNKKTKKNPNRIVICDAAYVTVTPVIVFLSKILRIKIVTIVADIHGYMSDKLQQRGKKSIIKELLTKLCNYCWENYDGFILLTDQMNNIVNPNNKKYLVMEGIATKEEGTEIDLEKENYIMYAGGLHCKYGIKDLVDGFNMLDSDIELHLYGQGDAVEYIRELAQKNKKIKYMGVKPNTEVITAEKKAVLLVNPRPTTEEFTLYSFPSKTMEYMLTGTPVLMTKLPGMPKEYYEFIYCIEEESAVGIKESIEKVIQNSKETLLEKGKNARKFIIENKNNEIQGKRIVDFIKNI